MSAYIENPKTKGSGIVCCIPQAGHCPRDCADCFFQSGRSYLEPLEERTPNMPHPDKVYGKIVRVNDGNDSNHQRELVLRETADYPWRFYNTSSPEDLGGYGAPVVLTANPAEMTDKTFHCAHLDLSPNIMFIRIRTNTWNLKIVVDHAVEHWTSRGVPVVLTFMAYWQQAPVVRGRGHLQAFDDYDYRKRTLNPYWAITTAAWRRVMARYQDNPLVHSCGSEGISSACRHCGNCLREYFSTVERMRG